MYGAKTGLEALNSYFSEGDLRLKCKSGLVYVELKHARTLYNTACVYWRLNGDAEEKNSWRINKSGCEMTSAPNFPHVHLTNMH